MVCGANIFLLKNCDFESVKTWSMRLKDIPLQSSVFGIFPYIWGSLNTALTDESDWRYVFGVDFDSLSALDSMDYFDAGFDSGDSGADFGD